MKLSTAKREDIKLRIGISGASGFGKTYSALLMAMGLASDASKVAIIDTENGSSHLYNSLGPFKVLHLEPPFSPGRYIEAITICENEGMEVIIVDGISQMWMGKGGCLNIHQELGGRFQDWAKVTPKYQSFLDAILGSKCHIITTVRRKTDYSIGTNEYGRTMVIKHGTKEITREGFEYELTVNFELINAQHLVKASKDRTGLFNNKPRICY
ncbi:ATP-binding protein [Maribacter litopenaei]|uniref:ATP-binding protein n=1 Tax=Maribacter litopenaei TaxID=2976127 RepID=A0ABY5Y7S3_9FLAO|nr:ATP-binding protein [Maribacter litopenaei]UWX54906.1 ATP-binding protein [Maribacter litopenaei]